MCWICFSFGQNASNGTLNTAHSNNIYCNYCIVDMITHLCLGGHFSERALSISKAMRLHRWVECICSFFALFTCTYGLSVRRVNVLELSTKQVPYHRALGWQQSLVEEHIILKDFTTHQSDTVNTLVSGTVGTILLLQHEPVYTLGTGTTPDSGPFASVCSRGKPLQYETTRVDRAGEATYHGPGQLVLYPVLDLVSVLDCVAFVCHNAHL